MAATEVFSKRCVWWDGIVVLIDKLTTNDCHIYIKYHVLKLRFNKRQHLRLIVNRLISCLERHLMNRMCIPSTESWWRHQMETFSALLVICAGNSPVTGEFPAQRPVTRSFEAGDFKRHRAHSDNTVMMGHIYWLISLDKLQ